MKITSYIRSVASVILLISSCVMLKAQETTITFVGKNAPSQSYIRLNSVYAKNISKLWEEMLYYPDTTLVLNDPVGIGEETESEGVRLLQNVPNPFDGTTDIALHLPYGTQLVMEIYDMNGRKVTEYVGYLGEGQHQFRATLSSPQTYLLSTTTRDGKLSIKMVNNGTGNTNSLIYLGSMVLGDENLQFRGATHTPPVPFTRGDQMKYVGYAVLEQNTYTSDEIIQQQWGDEEIELIFHIPLPIVYTAACSNVTAVKANGGGIVSDGGELPVIARGVCWSINHYPTIADDHTIDGSGTGAYTSSITGLTPNTAYYVRAYATTAAGTAYGNEESLTTSELPNGDAQPCPGNETLTDYDGNVYNTVKIGNQCWMKENLRTTHYADATVVAGRYAPNNDATNVSTYGYLYDWASVMHGVGSSGVNPSGVQGICPDGWHLPSDAEWTQLTDYVGSVSDYYCGSSNGNIAKALSSTIGWNTNTNPYAVGNMPSQNNITGFSALPAGRFIGSYNYFFGYDAYFWSTTEDGSTIAYGRKLNYLNTFVYRGNYNKNYGYSVRCLLGDGQNFPAVTTDTPSNVSFTTATCGGNVTYDGNTTISARGVCWCTGHNPTVSGSHTTDGSGTGAFTSDITGLLPNTTYYVRAYATNSIGTSYGEEVSFTTACSTVAVAITGNTAIDYGQSTTLTASGADTYSWSTGANTASITVSPTANTVYSVTGTDGYGCEGTSSVTVRVNPLAPVVVTGDVSNIVSTTATAGGNVTADNGSAVTARGVCWGTWHNPTVSGSHTTDGSGTGAFTSDITGLLPNTTYYVRAYATNSIGTSYGEEVEITTLAVPAGDAQPCPSTPTVTDYDGNIYNTVKIGNQCWMKENLRTTHYADGMEIPDGTSSSYSYNISVPYRYNPANDTSNVTTYGHLYNWIAVMHGTSSSNENPSGVQGICPTGWHVPSSAEWTQLTDYVGNTPFYGCGDSHYIAKALASNFGWNTDNNSCTPGNNQSINNATGFNAMPATCYGTWCGPCSGSSWCSLGGSISIWSSTSANGGYPSAKSFSIGASSVETGQGVCYRSHGYSVRCVLGDGQNLPAVTTDTVSNIGATNATCGGNVTYDGNTTVTARGVCWDTVPNPTVSGSHTTDGSGTGAFTSDITGLLPNTTYYVRAYATNSIGTSYGEEVSFTTACSTVAVAITGNTAIDYGQSTTLTASGADTYSWSTGANTASITVSPTANTVYSVTGTDGYGCEGTASVTVRVSSLAPIVVTGEVGDITATTATAGGNVTADNGFAVTARGVCWGTGHNPTVSGSHTTDGSGTGAFTSDITGLLPNTTYYVRAYATNSIGTSYGEEMEITTLAVPAGDAQPCPGTPTVTDYDGNIYNTVKIGNQCWMKENLRTTKYANGTSISQGSSTSTTTAYWYYPDNNSSNKPTYGLLYNWKAVMRNSSSSSANPSGVQGICPDGWHVPSDAEWTQLTDYVSSQSDYVCGSNNSYIAKALAGTTGWDGSNETCAVGNTPSQNNSTGFSALPAGYYDSSYNYFGYLAYFWSATEYSSGSAYHRNLSYYYAIVYRYTYSKNYGCSVRCLRD